MNDKHILTIYSLCWLSCTLFAQGQSIRLGWSANSEPDLSHYIMYRDTLPGTAVFLDAIPRGDTTYIDLQVAPGGTYYYKLTAVDSSGNESGPSNEAKAIVGLVAIDDPSQTDIPQTYRLKQNFPNPFNPTTKIEYSLPVRSRVRIRIYDNLGQEIRSLVDEDQETGSYQIQWDGKDNGGNAVSSGVYYYQMTAEGYREVRKLVLQK